MKTGTLLTAFVVILGVLILAPSLPPSPSLLHGEPPGEGNATTIAPVPVPHPDVAIHALQAIAESVTELKEEVSRKEEELHLARREDQKARILKELATLNGRLESLLQDFGRIATGVNPEAFAAKPREHFDWREQLQEVLGPIIKELQSITAHPREIDRLQGEAAHVENQIATARSALQNVQRLSAETRDPQLVELLQGVEKDWRQKDQQLSNQLTVVRYQLNEKLKERKPFLESFQNLMQGFFKNRGRNLFFAVLAFVLVLFLFRLLYRLIYRFSPLHKTGERNFYTRLTDLAYYAVSLMGATGALLLVLYVSADWLLLSVAALFLLGIAWTARQTLPRFWTEAKFLLNLGTVREGERLVYHGIPWEVQSLNFHTQLVNPLLKGGVLRLPLRELMDLRSRPYDPAEPWFPCKPSEWVILADGTLGQVAMQTPEMVALKLLGGSRKTYPTAEFLHHHPTNISAGYRLTTTFRLDYQHQRESTAEIPETLKDVLSRELQQEDFGRRIISVGVEFKEAKPSSLELAILVEVGEKAGRHYDRLTRLIPRLAVEASSEYGWVIPSPQLTVHTAAPHGEVPDSPPEPKGKRRWGLWRKGAVPE